MSTSNTCEDHIWTESISIYVHVPVVTDIPLVFISGEKQSVNFVSSLKLVTPANKDCTIFEIYILIIIII